MKTTYSLIALILTLTFAASADDNTNVVGKFIRKPGKFLLDGKGSALAIAETSPGKWSLDITWYEKGLPLSESPDILRAPGWFVYVETPDRLWIYSGGNHLVLESHTNGNHLVSGMSPEIAATCPKIVHDALPKKAEKNTQPAGPFVQNDIKIVPPVTREGYDPVAQTYKLNLINDGGTRWIKITDAEGKPFDIYIDHRIGSTTPGAIYLNASPGKTNSVRVLNEPEFRRKMGVFSESMD